MKRSESSVSLLIIILLFAATATGFQTRTALANHPGKTVMAGEVTTKKYDPAGNLISVTRPEGGTRTMEYDRVNRLISVTDDPPDIPDGGGDLKTRYEYDDNSNLRHQYDPSYIRMVVAGELTCPSCQGVLRQFLLNRPNIIVEIVQVPIKLK